MKEQVKELFPAYALGVLSNAEAGQVEDFLATNSQCRQEVSIWQELIAELAFAAEPQTPPARLRAQLLEQIRQLNGPESFPRPARVSSNVVPMPPRQSLRQVPPANIVAPAISRWWLSLAAAVAVVALLSALFTVWRKNQSLQGENRQLAQQLQTLADELAQRQNLLGPDGRSFFLQGTQIAPKASANLSYNVKSGAASLEIKELPPAPAGKSYQIWFSNGRQTVPGTTFNTDPQGVAHLILQIPDNGLHPDTIAVTLEPQYGATAPTGEKYLVNAVS